MLYVECGRLFDGRSGNPIERATMIVDGERIRAVEQGFSHTGADQVVDLRAFSVLPGLVDGHDHFGIDMGDGEQHAMQDAQWRVLKGVKNARAMLASGITTLRNAGEKHHLGRYLREAIDRGWIVGPRAVLSGVPISSTGGHGWFLGMEVDGADAVRRAVRDNVKAGADMIKMIVTGGVTTHGGTLIRVCFTREEIQAAVDEAHLAGKRIGVHCYGGDAATWAIRAGVDSIEHGTYLTDEHLDEMARRGTILVSTSSVMRAAANAPDVAPFMRERFRQVSEDYVSLLRRAHARGLKVAVGCDTHHASMADEVHVLEEAGYDAAEALRAATLGGAELCGLGDQVGSLEAGKLADFIAVEGDVAGNLAHALKNVRAVFKGAARQPV